MYGWERITRMCGLGCKSFWSPWAQDEQRPYDAVNDEENDAIDATDPVTSEPQKPIWTNNVTPIVRNKSGSVGNLRTSTGYERVSSNSNIVSAAGRAILNEKRNSTASLNITGSVSGKALLNESKDISDSRASLTDEKLQIQEMVTTV